MLRVHRSFLSRVFLLAVCLVTLGAIAAGAQTEPRPELDNGVMRVVFDAATGQLAALTNLENGHELIGPSPDGELWQIDVVSGSTNTRIVTSTAREFRWRKPEGRPDTLELVWQDFEWAEGVNPRVTATVSLPPREAKAYWRISVDDLGDLRLAAVRFPRVTGVTPQENEVLAVPVWMGHLMTQPRRILCKDDAPHRFEWETPGLLSLQCLAFYRQDGPGLYIATDDNGDGTGGASAKRFAVFGGADRHVGLEVVHLPKSESGQADRYEMPYRTIVAGFTGDWFTVAEQYRQWGLEQPWAKESRLSNNAIADWATNTGLWVWNRGRSGQVLTPAVALREQTGLPVSVFWHWWHGCSYDTGFPEYLPPREGAEPFALAIDQAREAGVHAIVYMNQRLWGMTTKSWTDENAEQYAVKNSEGKVQPEVYNTFTKAPCASMCMGTQFWRAKYAGLAEQTVIDLGVAGIYMDQACSSLACHDPSHGHPLGGGAYWINGFRTLQGDIRERTRTARQVVLAGEGCGEAWLPYLDLMLSLDISMERYAAPDAWEPMPFFHAVYHDRAIFFGNYSSLTMPPYDDLWPAEFAPKEPLKLLDRAFSQQFRLEQARAFAWGQQPTIANFRPGLFQERPEEMDYVVRLAKLRMMATKYLLHGTMLRPPRHDATQQEIDISRLSIYAGQQEALKQYRKTCPTVLASAWQAPDRQVGVVVVNVSDQTQSFSLDINQERYPIAGTRPTRVLDAEGEHKPDPAEPNAPLAHIELAPCEARIYEFAPKN